MHTHKTHKRKGLYHTKLKWKKKLKKSREHGRIRNDVEIIGRLIRQSWQFSRQQSDHGLGCAGLFVTSSTANDLAPDYIDYQLYQFASTIIIITTTKPNRLLVSF